MMRKILLSTLVCVTIISSLNLMNIGIGKIAADIPTCVGRNREGSFESIKYKCNEGNKPEMA
uniref:Uncharacterized protein n=1 Tax=Romanomermis culicivorax TaxID=13658 RepID=A0A915J1C1_ROMCU